MRFVDRYAGIPVCAALSVLNRIASLLKFNSKYSNYKNSGVKILIIELPEMGSALLSSKSISKLKNFFNNPEIFFLIFEKNKESVSILNIIPEKNIITIESKNFFQFIKDTLKTIIFFRKQKIDIIFDFEMFSRFSSIYSFLISYKEYAGFHLNNVEGLYRGNFLTKHVTFNYYEHLYKNYIALIDSVIFEQNEEPMLKKNIQENTEFSQIQYDKKCCDKIRSLIKKNYAEFSDNIKICILSPDAGEIPLRGWKYENYEAFAKMIIEKHTNFLVIISGTKNAYDKNEHLKNKINSTRCINITGETSLYEFIQLCHISKLLITNDGGAAHFSALTNINSFVFFGPETPVLYKPLSKNCTVLYKNYNCSPCLNVFNYRLSACKNNKCVNDFSPEEIYVMVKEKLCYIQPE